MKRKIILQVIVVIAASMSSSKAQNVLSQSTQVELGIGYVLPFFNKGNELLRANELRENQQSYFADELGNRNNEGTYSRSSGYNFSVGFYKPIKKVKGLMLGAVVRNAQTGSTPEIGGYEEAYFFNFITAGLAVKYYPFENNNLFLKTDFGLAAVLTKNRYINSNNEQNFFHQFGIGNAFGFELGYGFTPFKNKSQSLEIKTGYQLANTRVEVNGIGDDGWQFGALSFGISFNF
jgi:hypothetical protein